MQGSNRKAPQLTTCKGKFGANQRREQNGSFNTCLTKPVKLREACQHGPPYRNTSTGQRCSPATTRHTAPLQAAQYPSQYQCGTLAVIVGCAARYAASNRQFV